MKRMKYSDALLDLKKHPVRKPAHGWVLASVKPTTLLTISSTRA